MTDKIILIVDDDAVNIFALKATLKARGYRVESAVSAREAIEFIRRNENVGIVLLDMMMPEIDGYEAIPIIRDIRPAEQLPVIAVTAQAMTGDREKCLAAGADDYISKPIDVDKLESALKSWM